MRFFFGIILSAACVMNVNAANSAPVITSFMTNYTSVVDARIALDFSVTDADGDTLSIEWTFGDGNTHKASQTYTEHIFTTSGTFNGQVTVSDGTDSETRTFQVLVLTLQEAIPTARFTASKQRVLVNEEVVFDGTGTLSSSVGVVQISWSFGDGTQDVKQTLSGDYTTRKSWSETGIYTVTFFAISELGYFDAVSTVIHVVESPGLFTRYFADLSGDFQTKKPANATFDIRARISSRNFGVQEGSTIAVEILGERFETTVKKNFKAKGWKIRISEEGFVELQTKVSKKGMGEMLPHPAGVLPVFIDLGSDLDGQKLVLGIPFDTFYSSSSKSKMKFYGRF